MKHVVHFKTPTPHPLPCGRHKCLVPNHSLIVLPMHETKNDSLRCFFHQPRNLGKQRLPSLRYLRKIKNEDMHTIYFKRVLPIKFLTFTQKKDKTLKNYIKAF